MSSGAAGRRKGIPVSDLERVTDTARRCLAALPGQPLPEFGDLGVAVVTRHAPRPGGALLEAASLPDGRSVIGLFQFTATGATGALVSMLAWSLALRHMLAGAYPNSALGFVRDTVAERFPDSPMVTGTIAIVDSHDNLVTWSAIGSPAPVVYRRNESGPMSAPALRQATVRALGSTLDETRVYLMPGDWFVVCSAGTALLLDEPERRQSGAVIPYKWLTGVSPGKLAERIGARCAQTEDRDGLIDDVAVAAVRVPPVSGRSKTLRQLGFQPDEPVRLVAMRYFEEMDNASAGVLRAMDRNGYSDAAIRQMKIVLAELLVNAIEHGNQRDPGKRVLLGYVVSTERARISIQDDGPGFDPRSIPDPTTLENLSRDRGRGLFLCRHFTDEITHNERGNCVTVVKRFSA